MTQCVAIHLDTVRYRAHHALMEATTTTTVNKLNGLKDSTLAAIREYGIQFSNSALHFFENLGQSPAPKEESGEAPAE